MTNETNIALQILILNDLLFSNVIDKELYNKAIQKIKLLNNEDKAA